MTLCGGNYTFSDGYVGIGVAPGSSDKGLVVAGAITSTTATTYEPTGTTQSLDWSLSNSLAIDLDSASGNVTLSFVNMRTGGDYILKVIQGSVARNIIWPDETVWVDNTPTIKVTEDAVDIIHLWNDGTNVYAEASQPSITEAEHYNQHSDAIQTILKDLDGYVTSAQGADGYVAFFTGSGAIAGDNDLFFNRESHTLSLGGATSLILPQVGGSAATPALAFGDGDTGFYEPTDDDIRLSIGGAEAWTFSGLQLASSAAAGPKLLRETSSATNPVFVLGGDNDTGIGRAAADHLSLIAGGFEGLRITGDSVGGATVDAYGDLQVQGNGRLVLPSVDNAAAPTLAFGSSGLGFYEKSANTIGIAAAGSYLWRISSAEMGSITTGGPVLRREVASDTNPVLTFAGDLDTGIGAAAADQLSLIAGGVEGLRVTESTGQITVTTDGYMGIGGVTPGASDKGLTVDGAVSNAVAPTYEPTGTTLSMDLSLSNSFTIELDSATGDITLSLVNMRSGASYLFRVIQGATPRDIVWPDNTKWPDSVTPVISTAEDAEDIVSLWYDGTYFYGNVGQNYGL